MKPAEKGPTGPEKIRLILEKGGQFPLAALFGKGVRLRVETGVAVRDLLCRQLGVAESYLDDRVQTVFVNGRPVDDLDGSRVDAGDVLSLSAAMPGLVGATLRRGGHLAALRQNISHAPSKDETTARMGSVTLKLFNLVARELGPHFLSIGVIVSGRDLAVPLRSAERDLQTLERNGAPVSMDRLSDLLDSEQEVLLQVQSAS